MPRINRRRLLKLSGAGTLAAGSGLAGILASGRAPAYAQGTALHWLKFVDFVPVSDQLLKGKMKDECQKGARHLAHGRNHQRRRGAGAHHLGDPVQDRSRHHDGGQQLGAALRRQRRRRQRHRRGGRQGAGRLFRDRARRRQRRQEDGSRCRSRSSACCSSTAPRGSPRKASRPTSSPRPGRTTARSAKSSRPRTGRLVRRWPMRSATGRPSGIPICGRGAARRSRPTARPSCSTARRPSSRSSSRPASGRTPSTRAACHGTTPATTAPFSPTRSVRPATALRSICWRAASPTPT